MRLSPLLPPSARNNISYSRFSGSRHQLPGSISKPFTWRTWKQQADGLLKTFQSWANYRRSFTNAPIPEGTFALAKKYQLQAAASNDESFRSNVTFSPVASRTRGKMTQFRTEIEGGNLPSSPEVGDTPDTPDTRDSPLLSPGPQELAHLMYPPTKDEQIVNTALVDVLNALTMHFPNANDWTLHRKSFKAEFEHASFEARTDGYLEDGPSSNKVRALIEVKPMTRRKRRNPTCLQEAAQMAAWIKSDLDVGGALNLPGRRLHVSQDRHQIFLIFADYTEDYIRYLNNTLPPESPRPFLKMNEFGPWDTTPVSEMMQVGSILLAIALRSYHDANSNVDPSSATPSSDMKPKGDIEQPGRTGLP
ncbi:uncharacterized protein BO80DRAFT_434909 [Aspergillus ibericus CBS 121593]|uniref:Uncharacterized protein n=1 Tax=Aspergillus ibericus CBS 121593 TaxID=1448316 RepID=A0A395GZR2_9EURO|nr:hypothetical protein BO80DRAFT_434909 [Aspergillus ibericus CBS 121593]RAL00823.1 hypothetical protein BO80DRAFT_434909 [Aspergillus ibericus CBS 121593]